MTSCKRCGRQLLLGMRYCDGCGLALGPPEPEVKARPRPPAEQRPKPKAEQRARLWPFAARYNTTVIVLGLVALNAALVFPLFWGGYTRDMGSIESSWLTDARFIAENFPHVSWDPLWYMGIPYRLTYPPALPYMMAGLHFLSGLSIATAYRDLTAVFYVWIPVSLFFFVYYVTRRRYPATIAALVYSIAPSFSYVIPDVRNDAASFGYAPWHLIVLLRYGEGPHISSLALSPLAALGLMHAMRRPSLRNIVLASLAMSAVALINVIGLFALAVILLVVIVSEMIVGNGGRKLKTALSCVLLTYGLCAFWYNLSFLRTWLTYGGGESPLGNLAGNLPALLVIAIVALAIPMIFFRGKAERQAALVVGGWLLAFSIITFAWYGMRIMLGPQGNRYMPEMNFGAAMAIGMVIAWAGRKLWQHKVKWAGLGRVAIALVVLVIIVLGSMPFLQVAHTVTRPTPDITSTSEFQVAHWLADHANGQLVYATGSHSFWLNVFTNVPQIRGGADQGATNPWWAQVSYQINKGENGTIAVLWARALSVRYIVVSSPGSADVFQDYSYPSKFEGLLPRVYNASGMSIYEVPLKQPGLVQVIDLTAYNRLLPIRDVMDTDHLSRYVEHVEQSSPVSNYHFVSNDQLEFETDLVGSDQGVLVRMTYDPGWQVYCNDQQVQTRQDLAGFILVEPQSQGHCHFLVKRVPTWDEWLGYGLTALTLVALAVMSIVRYRSSSPKPIPPYRS